MGVAAWGIAVGGGAAFDAYALAVGKVAHAWNYLHEALGRIFVTISGAERHMALAIWYSTESDRAQHSMLRAAIIAGGNRWEAKHPDIQAHLLELMKEVMALSDHRNNAVHMPASLYFGATLSGAPAEVGPAFLQGHPRAKRLVGKRLIHEFEWCERWTESLSRYANDAEASLRVSPFPWPGKPRRPSH